MEIRDYVKAKRRWLPALIAVPLVAGAATAGVVHLLPPETTAQVQGYVPPSLTNSDSQIGLYIARLNEGLLLGSVLKDITTQAQILPEDLAEFGVERSGQSDQFVVTVVTVAPPERAVAIAETVTKVGTAFVARQALSGADVSTEITRQNFLKAQNELFAYQDEIGDLDPNVTYNNVSRQLLQPDPRTNISALRAQQQELVGQVRRFNELKAIVSTTSGSLGAAQSQSAGRAGEVIAAESGSQILSSSLAEESVPGLRYIEPAGLAMVLAFMAVLGLSLAPDLFRANPTAGADAASGAGPDPGPMRAQVVDGPDGEPRLARPGTQPPSPNGVPITAVSDPSSVAD